MKVYPHLKKNLIVVKSKIYQKKNSATYTQHHRKTILAFLIKSAGGSLAMLSEIEEFQAQKRDFTFSTIHNSQIVWGNPNQERNK